MSQTLDISWDTIAKVLITGFSLYVLFLARDVVVWFFFALMISLLVEPAIVFLKKLYCPKVLAVVLVYSSILGALGLMIYASAPIFIQEVNELAQNAHIYFDRLNPIVKNLGFSITQNFDSFISTLLSTLQESSTSIIKAITVFFGGVASTLVIFVFAFYISLEERGPERFLSLLTPKKYEHRIIQLFEKAQSKVARWFGARVLACLFVGLAAFLTFWLLGIRYAFLLALIAGVLNFVPFIGPLVTTVLAVLVVGVSNSWIIALYVAIVLYVIQAIENNFVTPWLMKKILDLPPILVLVSLLVGGILFGILGMIFAVPVFGILYEFFKDFLERKRERSLESTPESETA